jgi:hypothetical protein
MITDNWGVQPIVDYIKESHLDIDSLVEIQAAESMRSKPRKGVLSVVNDEIESANGPPSLSKDALMMVDAAKIVAIAFKDGDFAPKVVYSDVEEGLKAIRRTNRIPCGWNISSYDMPILQLECIRYGIDPPQVDYRYGKGMLDLHSRTRYWAGGRSLTAVAVALGYNGIDPLRGGFEVAEKYRDGDMDSILGHVSCDIDRLFLIAQRYEKLITE